MSRVGALIASFLAVDMASRSAAAAHGAEGIIAGCCLAAAVATAALPMETSGRQLTVRDDESTQLLIGMVCLKCHARARLALAMPRCRLPCRAAPVARGLLGTSRPVAVCTTQLLHCSASTAQFRLSCFVRRQARVVQVSAEVDEEAKRLKPGAKPGAPPGAAAGGSERPHGTHADAV